MIYNRSGRKDIVLMHLISSILLHMKYNFMPLNIAYREMYKQHNFLLKLSNQHYIPNTQKNFNKFCNLLHKHYNRLILSSISQGILCILYYCHNSDNPRNNHCKMLHSSNTTQYNLCKSRVLYSFHKEMHKQYSFQNLNSNHLDS